MQNLADCVLSYLWTLNFSGDDIGFDEDWAVKEIESLVYKIENSFSDAERQAVQDSAKRSLSRWLAEPDEHGYTPRRLLKSEQRVFLESLASGHFCGPDIS